jgi:hypothetical protein
MKNWQKSSWYIKVHTNLCHLGKSIIMVELFKSDAEGRWGIIVRYYRDVTLKKVKKYYQTWHPMLGFRHFNLPKHYAPPHTSEFVHQYLKMEMVNFLSHTHIQVSTAHWLSHKSEPRRSSKQIVLMYFKPWRLFWKVKQFIWLFVWTAFEISYNAYNLIGASFNFELVQNVSFDRFIFNYLCTV